MIRLKMPPEPDDFATDPDIVGAKRKVEELVATAEKVSRAKQVGKKAKRKEDGFPNAEDFSTVWGRYKDYFEKAQEEKCAYCEGNPLVTGDGTIDHFRPKVEVKGKGNKKTIHRPGYWWLAYDWNNWLFSCLKCNRLKGNQFPVRAPAQLQQGCEHAEDALLIQPYLQDPECHFEFNEAGVIGPTSEEGDATIKALKLDREPLNRDRAKVARDLLHLLDDYDDQPSEKIEQRIFEFLIDTAKYAGMCRYLVSKRWVGVPPFQSKV
jgi:uncharacterized protein (TIGR02646 family)